MEEKEFIEEWAKQNRAEKRELFGELGLHDDCQYYRKLNGKPFCNVCDYLKDGHNSRKGKVMPCEKKMCYFYEPKKKGTEDGND